MWIWLVVLVVLIIVEIITPIELVSIWFMPAVIITAITSLFGISYLSQAIIFMVTSFIGVGFMLRYFRHRKSSSVNLEKYKGVHSVINDGKDSKIRINDVIYNVSCEGIDLIEGEKVVVEKIRGNTLIVKKIGE